MEINVSQIRKSYGETFKFHFVEKIGSEFENFLLDGPIEFDVTVTNTGRMIVAKGEITGNVSLQCGRCLEDFQLQIKANFEEQYCQENDLSHIGQEGIEADDCHVYNGDNIIFNEDVLETLALNIPMKPVCQENCRGICPTCGQNLNINECHCKKEEIDSRLEILKKFLNN